MKTTNIIFKIIGGVVGVYIALSLFWIFLCCVSPDIRKGTDNMFGINQEKIDETEDKTEQNPEEEITPTAKYNFETKTLIVGG